MLKVVAALIKKDNKILIAKRATGDEEVMGKWEFPGGKVEAGETEEKAIEREINEEFEVTVKARQFLANNICQYPNKIVDLRLYECEYIKGEFKMHSHLEFKWIDSKDLLKYDLAPADKPLAQYIIEKNTRDLVIGNIYTNNEIADMFKCSPTGGMRRATGKNALVLIAKHNNPLYDDQWTEEGILNYTGMGTKGDQSIEFAQNKTLAIAKEKGIKVHLFESYRDNEYYYIGEVEVAGPITTAKEKDTEGKLRKVLKYPLKLKQESQRVIIKEESLKNSVKIKEKQAKKLSYEELKKSATKMKNKTYCKKIITTYRERNPIISQYTKRRANGHCDLCGSKTPFDNKKGEPFLESHHIIMLAEEGPDVSYNTVALCPNCHRRVHVLKEKKDLKRLVEKVYEYVKEERDEKQIEEFKELFKNIKHF